MKKILIVMIGFCLLTACTDPHLNQLKKDTLDTSITSFWEKEASKKSTLWNEAMAYCNKQSVDEKPNCAIIGSVEGEMQMKTMLSKGMTKAPEYASNPDDCF